MYPDERRACKLARAAIAKAREVDGMIKRLKWLFWDFGKEYPPATREEAKGFVIGIIIGSAISSTMWAIIFLVTRY